MPLAYILNPLDRRANDRSDTAAMAALRKRGDAKLIRIAGSQSALKPRLR